MHIIVYVQVRRGGVCVCVCVCVYVCVCVCGGGGGGGGGGGVTIHGHHEQHQGYYLVCCPDSLISSNLAVHDKR